MKSAHCSGYILQNISFKVMSPGIGGVAILANLMAMIKNLGTLKCCTTSVTLINKVLVVLNIRVAKYVFYVF